MPQDRNAQRADEEKPGQMVFSGLLVIELLSKMLVAAGPRNSMLTAT
jgi:hypothetical protein